MKIQVAEVTPYGAPILVAIVPPEYTNPSYASSIVPTIQRHYPTHPIMLVAVDSNGFRAYAAFETHLLLALIQLELLELRDLDLTSPPPESDDLPF
jgi:hypothetical protein